MRLRSRGSAWLPVLVGLLGAALVLVVWGLLVAERRSQTLTAAEAAAANSRTAIASQIAAKDAALQSLSIFWSRFGRQPASEWRFDSNMVIEHFPGIEWIAWVDPHRETPYRSVGRAQSALPGPELRAPSGPHRPQITSPMPGSPANPSGRYRVWLPVGDADSGEWLVAEVDVAALLAPVLRDSAPGYAITVRWGDRVIHQRGVPSARAPAWWHVDGNVQLPLGPVWHVRHEPTDELLLATLTPVPHIILVGGLVLSFLLGALVHQVRVTRDTVRRLDETNRALDARIREVSERDNALVRLNQDLEARVEARNAELRDAVEELEAFNYSVSHDLRSPLGAILNFAALLEEDWGPRLDPEGRDMLQRIQTSSTAGLDLLEGLLELSRAGQTALRREWLDVEKLVRVAWQDAAATAGGREAELVIDELPPAFADAALLADVFGNLFSNALKYTRKREKARIHVGGERRVGESLYWVADNGIGFDPRFAQKIFGVFNRLHAAEEFEGTGVGLAMVARIVRRHGGRVWAESQIGRGATFSFSISNGDGDAT